MPAAVRRQDVASGEYPKASKHQPSTASRLPQFPCSRIWHDLGHLLKKAVGGRLTPRSHWCCGPKAVRNATEAGEGNSRRTLPSPQPCMTFITGAAGAGNTVRETFISPCFLKLAIIPMIIIVRIYNKDITTVSDPCSPPALTDRHSFTQLPLSLCHFSSVITWTPTAFSPTN